MIVEIKIVSDNKNENAKAIPKHLMMTPFLIIAFNERKETMKKLTNHNTN